MTISLDHTIVGRIERLEARAAIERLMADYAFGCDQKDVQRFLGVFHDDAEYVGPTGASVGHEAIRESIRPIWQMLPETHHWITNVTVDFTGVDSASGEAHVITPGVVRSAPSERQRARSRLKRRCSRAGYQLWGAHHRARHETPLA